MNRRDDKRSSLLEAVLTKVRLAVPLDQARTAMQGYLDHRSHNIN